MEIFARVVEARSFSGAARRLAVSTSVVSKCVTRLEQSLGVRLLNRTTRSVSLTEIGQAFYARCTHIVAAAEEAEAMMAGMQTTPGGTLRVNVPVSFGVLHVAPALQGLQSTYPGLRIVTFNDREVHLAEEGYDAALVIAAEARQTLVARRLAPIRQALCAAPSYLRKHGVPTTLGDLARHDCILPAHGAQRSWRFESAEGSASVDVDGSIRLDNDNAVRQAALAGCGIALLPTYIVGADLKANVLRALLPQYKASETALFATYLPNRYLAAKVRVFVDYLVARFGPSPDWDAGTAPHAVYRDAEALPRLRAATMRTARPVA